MSKKQEKLSDEFWANLLYLQRDVGFQSRFSQMTDDYTPLAERVKRLEEILEALLCHLNLEAQYQASVTIREKDDTKAEV
jgi:signal transduction protein with GAF and PtsI domain